MAKLSPLIEITFNNIKRRSLPTFKFLDRGCKHRSNAEFDVVSQIFSISKNPNGLVVNNSTM